MPSSRTTRAPRTIDGSTLAIVPTPGRKRPQLDKLEGVRVEMARVYREMDSGKREMSEGTKLVYVLAQIGKVLEITAIERRIDLLEEHHATRDD